MTPEWACVRPSSQAPQVRGHQGAPGGEGFQPRGGVGCGGLFRQSEQGLEAAAHGHVAMEGGIRVAKTPQQGVVGHLRCQTAFKTDPRSASNIDPSSLCSRTGGEARSGQLAQRVAA